MRLSTAVSIVLLLASCSGAAAAAGTGSDSRAGQEEALRAKGNALMASARWNEALPIWAELFGLGGKSVDLWNAAVCQYHLAVVGRALPDQALALLSQYRDRDDVTGEKKAKAQRYIDEMSALKAQLAAGSNIRPPSATSKPSAEPSSPSAAITSDFVPQQSFFDRHAGAVRAAAWSAGAVAAASLGAGIYFSFRTHSLDNKVMDESAFSASDDSAGRQAEVLQYVMYGVSAVALATAGVLYEASRHHGARRLIGVVPEMAHGQSGLLMAVSF